MNGVVFDLVVLKSLSQFCQMSLIISQILLADLPGCNDDLLARLAIHKLGFTSKFEFRLVLIHDMEDQDLMFLDAKVFERFDDLGWLVQEIGDEDDKAAFIE